MTDIVVIGLTDSGRACLIFDVSQLRMQGKSALVSLLIDNLSLVDVGKQEASQLGMQGVGKLVLVPLCANNNHFSQSNTSSICISSDCVYPCLANDAAYSTSVAISDVSCAGMYKCNTEEEKNGIAATSVLVL